MELVIPKKLLAQHAVVLGKTGAGKSSTLRYLVEYLLDCGKRVCIIDPKGDWWGIKFDADGKKPGYPVIAFGDFKEPKATDVPLNEASGAHVAELIAGGNRPAIIGFRGWMPKPMTTFWIDFASTLFNKVDSELYLIISEVHNFAPKGKVLDPQAGKCLHWTNRIMSEARGIGLVCLIDSQRPAKVHNDTLTCCETLIAMKVTHPSDRGALSEWIKGCGDEKIGATVLNGLAGLNRGQAYVWCPEISYGPDAVQFPMFRTFDSFAPPQTQKKVQGTWATVDLEEVKEKLAGVIQEAKAKDPAELQKVIGKLKTELEQLKNRAPIPQPVPEPEVRTLPLFGEATAKEIKDLAWSLHQHGSAMITEASQIKEMLNDTQHQVSAMAESYKLLKTIAAPPSFQRSIHVPASVKLPPIRPVSELFSQDVSDNGDLPIGERAILSAIVQHGKCDRAQLTVLTGYKKSTRDSYIKRLAQKQYCTTDLGSMVYATKQGIDALGHFEPLPTGPALIQHYFRTLPEGESAIFQQIVQETETDRETLTQRTGYKKSTRDSYIKRLAAKKLVDTSRAGLVRLSEHLIAQR